MIHLHASWHLLRDPQARTTKTGGEFATCMLAVGDDTVVNIACFDADLCALLMKCRKGDGLSVAGKATVSVYNAKDGSTKPECIRHGEPTHDGGCRGPGKAKTQARSRAPGVCRIVSAEGRWSSI